MVGAFITAYGLEAVLIPNNVSDGGVIFLGYKQIGKSFAMYSVLGIASLAVGTVVMHNISPIIEGIRSW